MTTTRPTTRRNVRRTLATLVTAGAILVGLGSPAQATPQGYIADDMGVGYFYGTFDQSPNVQLLAGGTAEEFCEANPEDPFNAEPGTAPVRIFPQDDGSVDLKVNSSEQPIHLYEIYEPGPVWIGAVCADLAAGVPAPAPFASGTANLKVRLGIGPDDVVDVFNSVNGTATAPDGTSYKVRAWADLIVENGVPVGDPADFVGFEMHEIGR